MSVVSKSDDLSAETMVLVFSRLNSGRGAWRQR